MKSFITLINLFLITLHINAMVTITASEFNQLYSCTNPFILTTTTTVILDEDIVVDQCFPFVADSGFGIDDELIFTSTSNNQLIIMPQTVIDMRTFLPNGQSFIIAGNMALIVGYHVTIVQNGTPLIVRDTAHITFESIAP